MRQWMHKKMSENGVVELCAFGNKCWVTAAAAEFCRTSEKKNCISPLYLGFLKNHQLCQLTETVFIISVS